MECAKTLTPRIGLLLWNLRGTLWPMEFEIQPGDIRKTQLEAQKGWHPLASAVGPLEAGPLDDVVLKEHGDWVALYCIGTAEWPGPSRVVGLLVLPRDSGAIAAGGLGVNLLRGIISGLPKVAADWLTERFAVSARRGGQEVLEEWVRNTRRAVEDAMAKRPQSNQGFGGGFYARIARDAVSLRHKNVYSALQVKYLQDDPRPEHRRDRPITVGMMKQWIRTARHRFGFLEPGVFAPTASLVAYEERSEK